MRRLLKLAFIWLSLRSASLALRLSTAPPPKPTVIPLILTCVCHPNAKDRRPIAGEQGWTLDFQLDDGRHLYLRLGRRGRDALLAMLLQENADDMATMMGRPTPPVQNGVARHDG